MRECPKCHYVDPPNWRPPAFNPDVDYMRGDEFKEVMPELAKTLLPGKFSKDAEYAYYLSRTGRFVYRMWLPIYNSFGGDGKAWSHHRQTKMYDRAGRLNQGAWKRLLDVMKNKRVTSKQPSILDDRFGGTRN